MTITGNPEIGDRLAALVQQWDTAGRPGVCDWNIDWHGTGSDADPTGLLRPHHWRPGHASGQRSCSFSRADPGVWGHCRRSGCRENRRRRQPLRRSSAKRGSGLASGSPIPSECRIPGPGEGSATHMSGCHRIPWIPSPAKVTVTGRVISCAIPVPARGAVCRKPENGRLPRSHRLRCGPANRPGTGRRGSIGPRHAAFARLLEVETPMYR